MHHLIEVDIRNKKPANQMDVVVAVSEWVSFDLQNIFKILIKISIEFCRRISTVTVY